MAIIATGSTFTPCPASRSAKAIPRCAITVNAVSWERIAGPQRARLRSPVSATVRAATLAAATASRVSCSAAAAISAARSLPTAAASRVLACPGTGALATTKTFTGSIRFTRSPAKSPAPQ